MPDTRSHRGPHPEDAALFGPAQWPALRRASADLCWLLDRGYAVRSSLALVGDRHGLTQRQRVAVSRCACAAPERDRRWRHLRPVSALRESELWIDGYNLLISVEAALGGGVILSGRDGCYRDLASLHGTYRPVTETTPAITLIGEALAAWKPSRCRWLLDRPVSNSGRLKQILQRAATERGWAWEVELDFNPDRRLLAAGGVVLTSDSGVLGGCEQWANAAREIISTRVPSALVVNLHDGTTEEL